MCAEQTKKMCPGQSCSIIDTDIMLSDEKYIFCGRGKVNIKRPGNKKFAKIVQSNLKDYINAKTKLAKVIVVTSVVSFIRENGMKFVTYDESSNGYVELSSERILHTKVSHAIRDQIKQNKKNKNFAVLLGRRKKKVASNLLSLDSIDRSVGRDAINSKEGTKPKRRKTTSSVKKTEELNEHFNNSWRDQQKKNVRFDNQMLSASSIPKTEPASPVSASIFDDEGILGVSRTILDFGAKINETIEGTTSTSCGDCDILTIEQLLLEKAEVIATPPLSTPCREMEFSMLRSSVQSDVVSVKTPPSKPPLTSVSLSSPVQHGRFSPLPYDSEPEFAYVDMKRLSAILDGSQEDGDSASSCIQSNVLQTNVMTTM